MTTEMLTDEPQTSSVQFNFDMVGPARSTYEESGKLPLGKTYFIVINDYYFAHEVPGPYVCSSYSSDPFIPIDFELHKEFELWEAASDEDFITLDDSME